MSHFHNNMLLGSAGQGSYEIERSLRISYGDSAHLTRSVPTSTDTDTFTQSAWIKRSRLDTYTECAFFVFNGGNTLSYYWAFESNNKLRVASNTEGVTTHMYVRTERVFRDPSAWYHIVVAVDSTQATDSDRIKIYVNGELAALDQTTYPTQNFSFPWNHNSYTQYIGRNDSSAGGNYLAEVYNIGGSQLQASDFGETDPRTGAWVPKKYVGSFGTNGFYLDFSDNSDTTATTLGKDSSGNNNNWTPVNFSVSAGPDDDSMEDTPTNNWSTLNPLDKSSQITLSQGNLSGTGGSFGGGDTFGQAASTIGLPTSGKFLFEIKRDAAGSDSNVFGIGISKCDRGGNRWPSTRGADGYVGYQNFEYGFVITHDLSSNNVTYRNNNTVLNTYSSSSTSTSAVYGLAIDCDASTATFYENGTAISGALSFVHPGSDAVVAFLKSDFQFTVNFGQRGFSYPISGFVGLNTANLDLPAILDGTKFFKTKLYTGNGTSSQTVSGVGFKSDFIWIKGRSINAWHRLQNTVAGINKLLYSNDTASEATDEANGHVSSVTTDGFELSDPDPNGGGVNGSTETYASWNWRAGGAATTPAQGTIASTASTNSLSGFSIVSWTGTGGTGTGTVGHGLSTSPDFVIVKNRSTAGNWAVYHKELTNTEKFLYLNSGDNEQGYGSTFISPGSTTLTIAKDSSLLNTLDDDYIAYCFTEVPGFSKFGSYVGVNSTTGPYIQCGFRPAVLMVKNIDTSSTSWVIHDSARDPLNGLTEYLLADSNAIEASLGTSVFNFTATGFFAADNYGTFWSANGDTYVFMAFAETPFKYANAR